MTNDTHDTTERKVRHVFSKLSHPNTPQAIHPQNYRNPMIFVQIADTNAYCTFIVVVKNMS
jgi:hypothetical protein